MTMVEPSLRDISAIVRVDDMVMLVLQQEQYRALVTSQHDYQQMLDMALQETVKNENYEIAC